VSSEFLRTQAAIKLATCLQVVLVVPPALAPVTGLSIDPEQSTATTVLPFSLEMFVVAISIASCKAFLIFTGVFPSVKRYAVKS
jgi:hypothetical protein